MGNKIDTIINIFESKGIEDIRSCVSDNLWKNDPEKALVLAIERLDIFDNEYYLYKNNDVKNICINPAEHFVKYGFNENRKFRIFDNKYKDKKIFTIVSACYNVENYLDDFFKSLESQTIAFKKKY